MRPFDVCVVGHVTRDRIRSDGVERNGAGGVACYAALTLRRLGHRVAVITRLAGEDRDELLAELRSEGIAVYCGESTRTSSFECVYSRQVPDERILTVGAVAEAFEPADLEGVFASWFYLGPLTNRDMSLGFVRAASARGRIALDAQGLVRQVDGCEIRTVRPVDVSSYLQNVSLLKADEREAATLSSENDLEASARRLCEFGPDEVILTRGSKGSMIFASAGSYAIDAVA